MAKFKKGRKKTGGRKKGSGNKFTGLKDAFIEAFQEIGAARGLIKWIRKSGENQKVFYTLIARMLPAEMKRDIDFGLSGRAEIVVRKIIVDSVTPRPNDDYAIQPAKETDQGQAPAELTDAELEAEIRRLRKEERREHDKARGAAKGKAKKAKR